MSSQSQVAATSDSQDGSMISAPAQPLPLSDIHPSVPADRLLGDLVPPRHFAQASFDSYRADPAYPSQQAAVDRLRGVAQQLATSDSWLRRFKISAQKPVAVYLDGGFGVGKTHLLASLTHQVGADRTAFGTFVEFTNLVGALGFANTVTALATKKLVCIDEFELDDPGDTVLMSRLLRELADRGIAIAATSNTLPDSLGEGRFAADDFLREIQALADRFEVLRVDGQDYRRRSVELTLQPLSDAVVAEVLTAKSVELDPVAARIDSFDDLLDHLTKVHPSRYGAMLDQVAVLGITGVHPLEDQSAALRFVVLVDRLYDREIPVLLGGSGIEGLFSPQMLDGGYRKKYFRTLSRLGALATQGNALSA